MSDHYLPEKLPLLTSGAAGLGVDITEEMEKQFVLFGNLLLEKNKVMNLTAVTDPEEVQTKHFLDSLAIAAVTDLSERDLKVIDVGTGAGFPGIPLKIVYPQLKITLMDSLKKRLNFLDEVIDEIRYENIETLHGRAEDIGHHKEYRGLYDLCVSRAVANLSSLCEYTLPLVKEGGMVVAYKSVNAGEEVKEAEKAIRVLGGELKEVKEFVLPGTDLFRSLVVIEKKKATPSRYPRKAGTPAKDPIR